MSSPERRENKLQNLVLDHRSNNDDRSGQGRIAEYRRPFANVGPPPRIGSMALRNRCQWQPRTRGTIDTARWNMQMQQIRYFLALCEERNFTRAAKRCGVSQPSLTNAIIALEQELGGVLFQRKPLIALTVLGHAVHPYLGRIAQNAEHARQAAQAMADVRRSTSMPLPSSGLSYP